MNRPSSSRKTFLPPATDPTALPAGTKQVGKDGYTWQVVAGTVGVRWLPVGRLARGLYVRRESARSRAPRAPRAPPRPLDDPQLLWVRTHRKHLLALVDETMRKPATTREGLLRQLRTYRDGWEAITRRNQDLSDERLEIEPTSELRAMVKSYASDEQRAILAGWLAQLLIRAVR